MDGYIQFINELEKELKEKDKEIAELRRLLV